MHGFNGAIKRTYSISTQASVIVYSLKALRAGKSLLSFLINIKIQFVSFENILQIIIKDNFKPNIQY